MNTAIRFAVFCALLRPWSCLADTPVRSTISYDPYAPSNKILVSWATVPGKHYAVRTTPILGQPWHTLNLTPLVATTNQMSYGAENNESSRFYRVVKLDTEPPEVWRLSPADGAIAVARQSALKVHLTEETAIDLTSISLSLSGGPTIYLSDPRLTFTNGVLTYTPFSNEFFGPYASTVTVSLSVADTLGYGLANYDWSFQLEQETVLAESVLLIGNSSALPLHGAIPSGFTLVSTNENTFVFRYTAASSGLTNGQILVSTDPSFAYKSRVISFTEDPQTQTVTVLTEPVSLAELFEQASVRLTGDVVAHGSIVERRFSLDGTVIYQNANLKVEIVSGFLEFDAQYAIAADFNRRLRPLSFDAEIFGAAALDLLLRVTAQQSGYYEWTKTLITPVRKFIGPFWIGIVPVWLEVRFELDVGCAGQLYAEGSITTGLSAAKDINLVAQLRNRQWTHSAEQNGFFAPLQTTWEIYSSVSALAYLEPKLTIYLESLAGASVSLTPYLKFEGYFPLKPFDPYWTLYAGLNGELAVEARFWDEDWGELPSWDLFGGRIIIAHDPPTAACQAETLEGQPITQIQRGTPLLWKLLYPTNLTGATVEWRDEAGQLIGTGNPLRYVYTTAGVKTVHVMAGGLTGSCSILVRSDPIWGEK